MKLERAGKATITSVFDGQKLTVYRSKDYSEFDHFTFVIDETRYKTSKLTICATCFNKSDGEAMFNLCKGCNPEGRKYSIQKTNEKAYLIDVNDPIKPTSELIC